MEWEYIYWMNWLAANWVTAGFVAIVEIQQLPQPTTTLGAGWIMINGSRTRERKNPFQTRAIIIEILLLHRSFYFFYFFFFFIVSLGDDRKWIRDRCSSSSSKSSQFKSDTRSELVRLVMADNDHAGWMDGWCWSEKKRGKTFWECKTVTNWCYQKEKTDWESLPVCSQPERG